jgi:hypothetical protein
MRGIGTDVKYEELHSRYGTHVAQRLKRELSDSEFSHIGIDQLQDWLEARAETAHNDYRRLLNNPLSGGNDADRTGDCCRRWREAEDLAYLVAIADDVDVSAKTA